jgi:glycosyltransferase involved in cell wall biosynthesis
MDTRVSQIGSVVDNRRTEGVLSRSNGAPSAEQRPQRIVVDGEIYGFQSYGGISRQFDNLLARMAVREDIGVRLVLPVADTFGSRWPASIERVCLPAPRRLRPSRLFAPIESRWNSRAKEQFWNQQLGDVLLSTFYTAPAGNRMPLVQIIQDMTFERFPHWFDTANHRRHVADKLRAIEHATVLVCPSTHSRRDLCEIAGIDPARVSVILYAIDDLFRQSRSALQIDEFRRRHQLHQPYVLCTGGRFLHKNFVGLLAAFARWPGRHHFRLVSVGGGPLSGDESAIVDSLRMQQHLTVIPSLSADDLVTAYHAAAGFIFPTHYEGFGFPVIEALACGVPTACSGASCLPEVGGSAPWYFDSTDTDAIIAALEFVATSPRTDPRWSTGVSWAQRRSWDDVSDDFVCVCRMAMDAR